MSRRRPRRSRPSGIARGKRFVILAAEFNRPLTDALVRGALRALERHGAAAARIRTVWVPGAFELPVVAARAVKARPRPDAVIALGVLIRGETAQYEVIAHAVAQGLGQVSVTTGVPVTFGVIVAETPAQARARAGGPRGNRGEDAALAALSVLQLFHRLRSS